MTEEHWMLLGAFIVGIMIGSLILAILRNKKNKIPSIGSLIELKSFFNSNENDWINSKIIITGNTQEHKFDNLFIFSVELINKGSQNYDDFSMGVTLKEGLRAIDVKQSTSDRHHVIDFVNEPKLENQQTQFDFHLKPFNKKDKYVLDIHVVSNSEDLITKEDLKLSTPMPVNFVKLVSTTDFVYDVIQEISIGGLKITLRK